MCERVALPGGGYAIVCGGHRRRRRCEQCGRPADFLCDGPRVPGVKARPVEGGDKACSKALCGLCVHRRGEQDYCDEHAAGGATQQRLAL